MKNQVEKDGEYGVENIKNAFALVANISEGAYEIIQSKSKPKKSVSVVGGIVLKSMGKFPKLAEIPKEYKDMSAAEREEVNQDFAKELELPNSPKIELMAEKAQTVLNLILDLGFDIVQAKKAS